MLARQDERPLRGLRPLPAWQGEVLLRGLQPGRYLDRYLGVLIAATFFLEVVIVDTALHLDDLTGGALAIGILKAAVACHSGMATFAEAGVSDG